MNKDQRFTILEVAENRHSKILVPCSILINYLREIYRLTLFPALKDGAIDIFFNL